MQKKYSKYFFCLWIFLFPYFLHGQVTQYFDVKGIVLDSLTQQGIPFMSIVEKGTTKGASTDLDGSFSIYLNAPCILQFSALGFKKKEIKITADILKNNQPLTVFIEDLKIDTKIEIRVGGCCMPANSYPVLDLISIPSFEMDIYTEVESKKCEYITTSGIRITKEDERAKKDIFYGPNENQLNFFLSNNR